MRPTLTQKGTTIFDIPKNKRSKDFFRGLSVFCDFFYVSRSVVVSDRKFFNKLHFRHRTDPLRKFIEPM